MAFFGCLPYLQWVSSMLGWLRYWRVHTEASNGQKNTCIKAVTFYIQPDFKKWLFFWQNAEIGTLDIKRVYFQNTTLMADECFVICWQASQPIRKIHSLLKFRHNLYKWHTILNGQKCQRTKTSTFLACSPTSTLSELIMGKRNPWKLYILRFSRSSSIRKKQNKMFHI